MARNINTIEEVLTRYEEDPETGCWNWTGNLDTHGYGHVTIDNKTCRVHRLSYGHYNGPLKKNLLVCHKCDNRKCFNPDHLFQGTHKENSQDMLAKGRWHHPVIAGEQHGSSRLTEKDVIAIRSFAKRNPVAGSKAFLSRWFGIDDGQISKIINRKRWKHI